MAGAMRSNARRARVTIANAPATAPVPALVLARRRLFRLHASSGDHGLSARDQEQRKARPAATRGAEDGGKRLERDVALLGAESLDPDMLDERARAMLSLARPDDVIDPEAPRTDLEPGYVLTSPELVA